MNGRNCLVCGELVECKPTCVAAIAARAPGLTADVARIKRIEQLERELSEAKARNQRLMDAGGRLFEELDDKTPEPNCRCHVFPPCSDCTSHASSREALKEWKEAKP